MTDWLDGWERRPRSDSGPMLRDVDRCLLFHTMEGSFESGVATLDKNSSWPHLAYDPDDRQKIQAISFSRAGKALANKPGGVETNKWGVIQVELARYAGEAHTWPDEWLRNIAEDVVVPVMLAQGVQLHAVQFFGTDAGFTLATASAPQRMTFEDWLAFDGLCGHQHAPENDHWDPGKLNVPRIMEHARAQLGAPTTSPDEESTVKVVVHKVTRAAVFVEGRYIVDSLGFHVFGGYSDPRGATFEAIHGLVELEPADFERLSWKPTDRVLVALRQLVAWIAQLFPGKAAKTPPPAIDG